MYNVQCKRHVLANSHRQQSATKQHFLSVQVCTCTMYKDHVDNAIHEVCMYM